MDLSNLEKDTSDSGEGGLDPDTFKEEMEDAQRAGFKVIAGDPDHLLLDLDSDEEFATFEQRVDDFSHLFVFDEHQRWRSKSGKGWHAYLKLRTPIHSAAERIALQAALGSDPKREALSIARLQNGITEPSRLFQPQNAKIETFPEDDLAPPEA